MGWCARATLVSAAAVGLGCSFVAPLDGLTGGGAAGVDASGDANAPPPDAGDSEVPVPVDAGCADAASLSTVAGSGTPGTADGKGTLAQFDDPASVAVDGKGDVFVADENNGCIREILPDDTTSTFAGACASGAPPDAGSPTQLWNPNGVAVDGAGNVFVADFDNRIYEVTRGMIALLSGDGNYGYSDGASGSAEFASPRRPAVDGKAQTLYVADSDSNCIRKVSTVSGYASTLAGACNSSSGATAGYADGASGNARFNGPRAVALDPTGRTLYVADYGNDCVRAVDTSSGATTSPFVGCPADGGSSEFSKPQGIAVDAAGNVYVADTGNNRIRKIDTHGTISTLAATGLSRPLGIAIFGCTLFVADSGDNQIRAVTF